MVSTVWEGISIINQSVLYHVITWGCSLRNATSRLSHADHVSSLEPETLSVNAHFLRSYCLTLEAQGACCPDGFRHQCWACDFSRQLKSGPGPTIRNMIRWWECLQSERDVNNTVIYNTFKTCKDVCVFITWTEFSTWANKLRVRTTFAGTMCLHLQKSVNKHHYSLKTWLDETVTETSSKTSHC